MSEKITTDLHNCPLIYVHSLVVVAGKNLSHFWMFQSAVFKVCLCVIFERINWKASEWKRETLWPQLYMPLKMNKFRFFSFILRPCHRLLENTSICFVSWRRRNKQHLDWWSINAFIFFSWNIRRKKPEVIIFCTLPIHVCLPAEIKNIFEKDLHWI